MATELLTIGPVHTLESSVTYALPARACYIHVQNTAPVISQDGTTFSALPANGIASAAFIKSTGTNTMITLRTI